MITLNVGDRVTVKANEILGTPEAEATIVDVTSFGYEVAIDGDEAGWTGPIDFDGNVLC